MLVRKEYFTTPYHGLCNQMFLQIFIIGIIRSKSFWFCFIVMHINVMLAVCMFSSKCFNELYNLFFILWLKIQSYKEFINYRV